MQRSDEVLTLQEKRELILGKDWHIPTIEEFRTMTDYKIAHAAKKHLFIGRNRETNYYKAHYDTDYKGRILFPERRGEQWTIPKNMAFMAGAIEAGNNFLIVSKLKDIAHRAKRGLTGRCMITIKLGYATAEILWLQDNGYTFRKSGTRHGCTWALAPKEKVQSATIKMYGHTCGIDDEEPKNQVARINKIATEQSREDKEQIKKTKLVDRNRDQHQNESILTSKNDSNMQRKTNGRERRSRYGSTYKITPYSYKGKQGNRNQTFFNSNKKDIDDSSITVKVSSSFNRKINYK